MKKSFMLLVFILAIFTYNVNTYSKTYRSKMKSYKKSSGSLFKNYDKYSSGSKKKKKAFKSFSFGNKPKTEKIKLSSTASKKTYDKYLKNRKNSPKGDIPSSSKNYGSSTQYKDAYKKSGSYTKKSYSDYKYRYYSRKRYSPPGYYYRSYRSFGIWDSLFLWMMLDRISTPQYSRFYYSHYNDPDVKKFIAEANELSEDNEELKEKLDTMEKEVQTMKLNGVAADPNYIPEDISPELAHSESLLEKNFQKDSTFSIKNISLAIIIILGVLTIFSV